MLKKYGIFGTVKLIISLVYTKVFFRQARIIRLPFDIRNKRFIQIGNGFTTGFGCRLEAYPQTTASGPILLFGKNVEINDYVHIAAGEKVVIGDHVLIASKVFISDLNHGNYKDENSDSPLSTPNSRKLSTSPVTIKDNVWIGEGVCIMPGVTIGYGSIIGASSVVTKDIPDYSIAVGSPAKVVKEYDFTAKQWITCAK
jgi:acetyltransferase-like isoleucine patch superfamily enzyme